MDAEFTIRVDAARDLVCLTMSGFFEAEDMRRFVAARDDAHQQLSCAPNRHRTLVDIRAMRIQTQDIVAGFATVLADPKNQSCRLAFVVGSTLARMQVLRAAATRDARFFPDIRSARDWLLADEIVPEARPAPAPERPSLRLG